MAICDLSCILSYIGILAMGNSLQTLTNMLFLLRDIKIQNSCREGCHFINALCHNATFMDDSNSFFLCYSFLIYQVQMCIAYKETSGVHESGLRKLLMTYWQLMFRLYFSSSTHWKPKKIYKK